MVNKNTVRAFHNIGQPRDIELTKTPTLVDKQFAHLETFSNQVISLIGMGQENSMKNSMN